MVLNYFINLPVGVILTDTSQIITVQRMNTPPMQLDSILTELSFLIKWVVVVYSHFDTFTFYPPGVCSLIQWTLQIQGWKYQHKVKPNMVMQSKDRSEKFIAFFCQFLEFNQFVWQLLFWDGWLQSQATQSESFCSCKVSATFIVFVTDAGLLFSCFFVLYFFLLFV